MKDTKLARIKIIFVIVVTLIVVAYVYLVAPSFISNIDELRAENKQIEHDISEIEAMDFKTEKIKKQIKLSREELKEYEKRTDMDSTSFDMMISDKAKEAGVTITEMEVEDSAIYGDKKIAGKILYKQPVTISFEGDFKSGINFIEKLEKSEKGIFNVRDFLYSKGEGKDAAKSWMVNVDAYYYEEE